jgi:predicted nucleotidyltransferase
VELEKGLLEIVAFLEDAAVPYMVIGGFANLAWGVPRTTQDVDITVQVAEEDLPEFLREVGKRFPILPADPEEFVKETRVLPVQTSNEVRIDLIFAGLPYEETALGRAKEVEIQGIGVRICSPEDLIIHKIISERPRDREDVEGIFHQQRSNLDFVYLDRIVHELGKALSRSDITEFYEAMKRAVQR